MATDSNKNYVWLVHEESPSAISEATDLPATMVDRCRAQLPFLSPTVWPLTDLILEQVVTALRTLWDLLMTEDCEAIPHSEWNNRLIAQSMLRADAVRSRAIAVNILPVATRSDTETTIPNPDLEQLEAADLIGRLRQGIILRMHLRCPEATAGDLAEALHGEHPTVKEVDDCRRIMDEFAAAATPSPVPNEI